MRTTIDIPDAVMKKAKIKAVEEGITLKEFFLKALSNELETPKAAQGAAPWEELRGTGSAAGLTPEDSGFEGYSGPDWNHSMQLNEPDS